MKTYILIDSLHNTVLGYNSFSNDGDALNFAVKIALNKGVPVIIYAIESINHDSAGQPCPVFPY